MNGMDVVTAARKYLGARWTHQGRQDGNMDCAGLVLKVASDVGAFTIDKADYPRHAVDESMLNLCREYLDEVARSDAKPGDIAVMRFQANRHIGIFGDYPGGHLSLIHAYSRAPRKVVEHLYTDEWMRTQQASLMAVFRFRGLA